MTDIKITKGSREVFASNQNGRFSARLYVNNGETATMTCWKGKTEKGLRKWADKVLSR